jgi:enamine deaminase RidA (YjgF/YER057c/UK114 family)
MEDFPKVNEVYGSYFKADPPARVTVAVKELPRKSKVEIDAIAVVGDGATCTTKNTGEDHGHSHP